MAERKANGSDHSLQFQLWTSRDGRRRSEPDSHSLQGDGCTRSQDACAQEGQERSDCAPTDAAPKGKKRAASKGPEDTTGATPAMEEATEGEKVAGETSGSLIVAKAVRTLLKNHTTPIHLGSDALPALNAKVTEMIYEAIGRSLANGRKTLKNSDF